MLVNELRAAIIDTINFIIPPFGIYILLTILPSLSFC